MARVMECVFVVKEDASGQPFIVTEPVTGSPELLVKVVLSLHLPEGISLEEARKVADFINDNIVGVAYS